MYPQDENDHILRQTMLEHIGHSISLVTYGREEILNVALECNLCDTVLIDFDTYDTEES